MTLVSSGALAPPLLSPREAAELLRVSDGTVRRWLAEGRVEGIRVGGRLRVSERALEVLIRSAATEPEKTTL